MPCKLLSFVLAIAACFGALASGESAQILLTGAGGFKVSGGGTTIVPDAAITANGCKANGTAVATLTITCTPTVGATIIISLNVAVAITAITCKDNNNNALTAGPVITSGTTVHTSTFYGTVITGATSYVCNWTTNGTGSMALQSYTSTGTITVNLALTGNTASGSSATATITVTTEDTNDYVVCAVGDAGNTLTATVGTNRQQVTAGTAGKSTLMDNTVAAAGSVTCTATHTSSAWAIALIELRT